MAKPKLIGMPGARPFSTDATEKVFVVMRVDLENMYYDGKLTKSGVDYMRAVAFEGISVFGFSETELKSFLKKTDTVMVQRYGSTHANVEWVRVVERRHVRTAIGDGIPIAAFLKYQVQLGTWDGPSSYGCAYIAGRVLGPVLKRKIMLTTMRARVADYNDRSAFQINLWSTSTTTVKRDIFPPGKIWDFPVHSRDYAFNVIPGVVAGALLTDGAYQVAELLPNALYVHHNVNAYGYHSEMHLLKRICDEAAKLLKDETKLDAAIAAARVAYDTRQQELFAALVTKGIPARNLQHKSEIAQVTAALTDARAQLHAAARRAFHLEQAMFDPEVVTAKFKSELAKLQTGNVAFVERVMFAGTETAPTLRVYTDEVIAYDKTSGKHHLIGRYELVIDLNAGTLRFLNQDRIVERRHGPHIDEFGKACYGTIANEIVEYLAHYEIEAVVTLAIAYLQKPNANDSAGLRVRLYPVYVPPVRTATQAEAA